MAGDKFVTKLKPASPTGPETLQKERARSNIPVDQLAQHLCSQNDFLKRQEKVVKELQKHAAFSKAGQQNLSRPRRYVLGLKRAKMLVRIAKEKGWTQEDITLGEYLIDEMSPYFLQMSMFKTTITEQASEEQRRHWLPLIEDYQILGAYAQTELGHGSNVRGIELQATYDIKTHEFVLHSPTLTASKWWNGSLGRTATHAIVVAQLLLPDRSDSSKLASVGPQTFVIQIRDKKTHQPLPGIAIGDIGPKYGYPSMDNGYMLFDKHRVPHDAFLCRYAQVDKDTAAFKKPENTAVVYGSLTNTRVAIVMQARLVLARAVTVAVRYLCVRRQFRDRDHTDSREAEWSTLDYTTVQIRVLPLLAATYALHYSGVAMGDLQAENRSRIEKGDFGGLQDTHATSSGLKSLCTTIAADGIETCRRAMGGHGFGGGSGLIAINNDYLSKPTVEGDNWMITQQTASYLMKRVGSALEKPSKSNNEKASDDNEDALLRYLAERKRLSENSTYDITSASDNRELHINIVRAFERRAAHLAVAAHHAREVEKKGWNSLLVQLHELSNAHSEVILVRNFHRALDPASQSSSAPRIPANALPVMHDLFRLFAYHSIARAPLSFLTSHAISLTTLNDLQHHITTLMDRIRPHAVRLVDAWSIPEYLLDSALGRSDGKVYEELFERARNVKLNPLNGVTFDPYYWNDNVVHASQGEEEEVLRSKL